MPTGELRCGARSPAKNIGCIGTASASPRWKIFWRRRRAVRRRVDRPIAAAWNARGVFLGKWPEPAHDRYASTARLHSDRAETDARRRPTIAVGAEPAGAASGCAARGGPEPTATAAERQPARADRSDPARRRPLSSTHGDLRNHDRDGGAADRHGGDLHAGF